MSTLTFDALKFADRLEKAGASRKLAAAMAEAQREAFAGALDTSVATKPGVVRLDNKIDNRFDSLTKDIQALELRLTIKLAAFIAAAVGILIAVLRVSH